MVGNTSGRMENSDFKPGERKPRNKNPTLQLTTETRDPLKRSYTETGQLGGGGSMVPFSTSRGGSGDDESGKPFR